MQVARGLMGPGLRGMGGGCWRVPDHAGSTAQSKMPLAAYGQYLTRT